MPDGVWRDSAFVLLMTVLPVLLTTAIIGVGITASVHWQRAHGRPIALPSRTRIIDTAELLYAGITALDLLVI